MQNANFDFRPTRELMRALYSEDLEVIDQQYLAPEVRSRGCAKMVYRRLDSLSGSQQISIYMLLQTWQIQYT